MLQTKIDRRIRKTKNAIQNALIELIQIKRYDKITIQDILEKADVGRTTFYSHYQAKDDLLGEIINKIMESFDAKSIFGKKIIPIAQVLEHLKENKPVIQCLLSSDSSDMITKKLKEYWISKLSGNFKCESKRRNLPENLYVNYIVTSFIELIRWWIDNKMEETPKQMEDYWINLIYPSL